MVYQYQPVDVMQSFGQAYNMVGQIQQEKAQKQRNQMMQQAIAELQKAPTPQNIANFNLQFPEMKEQMDAYFGTLGEAKKNTLKAGAREAVMAMRTGGDPVEVFSRYGDAAANSGDEELAKQFYDAQVYAAKNPEAAQFVTKFMLAELDPDRFEALQSSNAPDPAAMTTYMKEAAQVYGYGTPAYQRAIEGKLETERKREEIINVSGVGAFRLGDLIPATPTQAVPFSSYSAILREQGPQAAEKMMKGRVVQVTSAAQVGALPAGQEVMLPDGRRFTKAK